MIDSSCLFCRKDEHKILVESDNFYARFDNFPATDGHIEVVSKRHVASFFDLSSSETAEAVELLRRAHSIINENFGPDGYTVGINDGEAAGRSIDHLHIHLIPRYWGDVSDPRGGIRQVVPNCYPDAWLPVVSG